jgi:hypothetical protein
LQQAPRLPMPNHFMASSQFAPGTAMLFLSRPY